MKNLESKFRLSDLTATRRRAEAAGFIFQAAFHQHDTFFRVAAGKLKLRAQADGAWLIHYHREHHEGLELSNYEIVPVTEPSGLRAMLARACGVLTELHKERTLLLRRNLRLHLDRVAELGDFGEIEAVVPPGESASRYRSEIEELRDVLELLDDDRIAVSYFELMRVKNRSVSV